VLACVLTVFDPLDPPGPRPPPDQSLRAAVPSSPAAGDVERQQRDVVFMRWARVDGARRGADLVRLETVKLFNARGQVVQVRHPPGRGPASGWSGVPVAPVAVRRILRSSLPSRVLTTW
jgi:hypothetical protein